jgi:hypothetical protein
MAERDTFAIVDAALRRPGEWYEPLRQAARWSAAGAGGEAAGGRSADAG